MRNLSNFKKLVIAFSVVITILLIITLYLVFFEDKAIFKLFGDEEISIYVGDQYNELGYIAIDHNGKNLKGDVKVKDNINSDVPGLYKVTYTLKSGLRRYKLVREVEVLEDVIKEVQFKLLGAKVVNISKGKIYTDSGFECIETSTKKDLKNSVKVDTNLNINKQGNYYVKYTLTYKEKTKTLTRLVNVFDETISYKVNNYNLTNKPVTIKITSNIANYAYTVLPNKTIASDSTFSYNFFSNGEYKFYIYDLNKNYEEFKIKITNIDMDPPEGSCKVTLKNKETNYTVDSKDNDLDYIMYDGDKNRKSSELTYKVDHYLREDKVILVDKAGNKTTVECFVSRDYKDPIKPKDGEPVRYKDETNSLKTYIISKDGYFLTRIWMKDPYLQVRKELISGGSTQVPKSLVEQAIGKYNLSKKLVIGANASGICLKNTYYPDMVNRDPSYNLSEPSEYNVYNGKVIRDGLGAVGGEAIYWINANNELKYSNSLVSKPVEERKAFWKDAYEHGIRNTMAFSPVLVENGQAKETWNDYYALRQGFCQLDENNFILVTSGSRRWNLPDFANFMQSLGCQTAVNFDGGGSVALLYKSKYSGNVETLSGNARGVTMALYFTELE